MMLHVWQYGMESGSYNRTIRIWNENGKCIQILEGHKAGVVSIVELNGFLFSASYDETVLIWNDKGKFTQELKGRRLAVMNGKIVTATWKDDMVHIWKFIIWNTSNHHLFPKKIRVQIQSIMILASNSSTLLYQLPNDILFLIFAFLSMNNEYQHLESEGIQLL